MRTPPLPKRLAWLSAWVLSSWACGGEPPSKPISAPVEEEPALVELRRLQAVQADLRRHVFQDDRLPEARPPAIRGDIDDPDFESLLRQARLDELSFDASQGLGSRAYHFVPEGSRRDTTLIFLLGHGGRFAGEAVVPETFVSEGYAVLMLGMILQGPNSEDRTVALPDGSVETLAPFHASLEALEPRGLQAMRLFLQPVSLAIDHVKAEGQHVVLAGISGGGWTADVYAALDPRVDGVVSIAGSIPHEMRSGPDLGDFEQLRARALYDIADFRTLYLLSALDRNHVQVFYERDACCFAWSGRSAAFFGYAEAVQDDLLRLGRDPSRFEVELVPDRQAHRVHPEAIVRIRGVLEQVEGER